MDPVQTVTTVINTLNNPLVQLGFGAAVAIGGVVLGALVQSQPKARDIAQDAADLDAALGPWVAQAEALIAPGDRKFARVESQAKDWLAQRGIVGRRGAFVKKYLPLAIEKAVVLQKGAVNPAPKPKAS